MTHLTQKREYISAPQVSRNALDLFGKGAGKSGAVWGLHPFQIVSLYDMLSFHAEWLYILANHIHSDIGSLSFKADDERLITDAEINSVLLVVDRVLPHCERLEMVRTTERLNHLRSVVPSLRSFPIAELRRQVDELGSAIVKDLQGKCFMYVPDDSLLYFSECQRPTDKKKAPLFGPLVHKNFKSTRGDVLEAGNCYAAGRYTACVFHSMRVLEKGLHALVHHLNNAHSAGIVFSKTVEETNWGNIIGEIQIALESPKRLRRLNPLPTRDEAARYSTVAIEFEHFKVAWRDDVSHSRRSYDQFAAKSVIEHVNAFMRKIAVWLRE